MEFTEDEYLVSSVLLSFRSSFPDPKIGSVPQWGCRKRRSIEDNAPLRARGTKAAGISPLTPVQDDAAGTASRKSSSPETSLGNSPICTDSCGPKQPRINKRKAPVTKSGTKLKTPEELKSSPDDCTLPNPLLKTEINRTNQLQNKVLKVTFVFRERGEELISRVSTQMDHISDVDPKIMSGQLLESDHHQPPLMVPNTNPGLITSKEAAALARQRRILICRKKKQKCQLPRKIP